MDHLSPVVFSLTVLAIWSILCRVNHMSKRTKGIIFYQHAALACGLFAALVVPYAYALHSVVIGVVLFLLLGSSRWKDGTPPGTSNPPNPPPIPLNPGDYRRVWGRGSK